MSARPSVNEFGEIVRPEPSEIRAEWVARTVRKPAMCEDAHLALLWGLLAFLCPGFGLFGVAALMQGGRAILTIRRSKGRIGGLAHAIVGMSFGGVGLLFFAAFLWWVASL